MCICYFWLRLDLGLHPELFTITICRYFRKIYFCMTEIIQLMLLSFDCGVLSTEMSEEHYRCFKDRAQSLKNRRTTNCCLCVLVSVNCGLLAPCFWLQPLEIKRLKAKLAERTTVCGFCLEHVTGSSAVRRGRRKAEPPGEGPAAPVHFWKLFSSDQQVLL